MSILSVHNLSKHFDGVQAVSDLSFSIERGTITSLIGPNGSGKTTVFNLITGFHKPSFGRIMFGIRDIAGLPPHEIFHLGIGRTFQNIRLFPQMSVIDNIVLGLQHGDGESLMSALMRSKKVQSEEQANRERGMELLQTVGLESKAEENAGNLSHGQRRLLEIARTIGTDSDFYLFDEPTAGVFPNTIPKLLDIIRRLRDKGTTILFIEHNMKVVMDVSEKIIVLDSGKKIAEGTPTEIQANKEVLDAYMGRRRRHAS